jgi:predicted ABC-type ATPase
MDSPILYVIAGPNGIGKTTSDYSLVPKSIPVINSDEIARELKNLGTVNVNTQEIANGEAVKLMEGYLSAKFSFGIETNLADVETWKSLVKIQESGYQLHVIYISTDNLNILNYRIQERFQLGGHFVRPDIVKERYLSGLSLLNHYSDRPDRLQLFDNTKTMALVAEIKKGKLLKLSVDRSEIPSWVTTHLLRIFSIEVTPELKERDLNSIEDVRNRYQESLRKAAQKKPS